MLLRCPSCQAQVRVPDNVLGRRVQCPLCSAIFETEQTPDAVDPTAAISTCPPPVPDLSTEPPARFEDEDDRRPRRRRDEDDSWDEELDLIRRKKSGSSSGLAVASLILGVVSFLGNCLCPVGPVTAILAIVFGILSLKDSPQSRAMAIAGICLGIAFYVMAVAWLGFAILSGL